MNRLYSFLVTVVLSLLALGGLVVMLLGAGYALLASGRQNSSTNGFADIALLYGLFFACLGGVALIGSVLALRWRARNDLGPSLCLRRLPGPNDWP